MKNLLRERLAHGVLIFDGAMGTMLQAAGLAPGAAPEEWNLSHPEEIARIHQAYIASGAEAVETNTFGGSPIKLREFGLEERAYEINHAAVRIARQAAGDQGCLVVGSIGPTGRFMEPAGDLSFDAAVAAFSVQARAFADAGADAIIVETMGDLAEIRAAVIAVKHTCGLPVICQMTFSSETATITGTDAVTAAVVLEALGADVIGANCSAGPEELLPVVRELARATNRPISVQPNAGFPRLVDGRTVFDLGPAEFAAWGPRFVEAGAAILGGCCGTTPEFIRHLKEATGRFGPPRRTGAGLVPPGTLTLSSRTRTFFLRKSDGPRLPVSIGERINPTSRDALAADIRQGKMQLVRKEARAQEEAGASILDVNVGVPGVDEAQAMAAAIPAVQGVTSLPLSLDTAETRTLERGLKTYIGKPLVNSVSGEEERLAAVLPLVKKFGAAVIGLTLDEDGIPPTAQGRLRVAAHIKEQANRMGIADDRIIIDPLVLTVGAQQAQAAETLNALTLIREELGLRTVLGISNVSFGLPQRPLLNNAFFALAVARGLDLAIVNVSDIELAATWRALAVLLNEDQGAEEFLGFTRRYRPERILRKEDNEVNETDPGQGETGLLLEAVLAGDDRNIAEYTREAVAAGCTPMELLDGQLIPGIEQVGELYGQGRYFLPQLVASARAMQKAFDVLEPLLEDGKRKAIGTLVFATVQGDLHDIGKNIVGALLRNYGFKVVDLGRNVPAEAILEAARTEKADIVALSALMTTTMSRMEQIVPMVKGELPGCKVMIGGAVVTRGYAERIGADGYADDAREAVQEARKLLKL